MDERDNNCRLCLKELEENCLSLFTNPTSDGPSLSTKIMVCLSLPIEPTTLVTPKICKNCAEEIVRFYDFRDKCLRTHYSLSRANEASDNQDGCLPKDNKPEETISDPYPSPTPQDEEPPEASRDPKPTNETPKSSPRLAPAATEDNPPEDPPEIPQNPPISLRTESQNPTYEYKCLHCKKLFSNLEAASLHCMECNNSSEVREPLPEGTITTTTATTTITTTTTKTRLILPNEKPKIPGILADPHQPSASPSRPRKPKMTTAVECSECKTKFSRASLLKRHMSVHTGERPYACETCNRRFSQMGQLNFHRKFHVNPRYRCTFCEKPFLRPSDVEKHVRTHTGEKPFTCDICDKSFAQLVALKQHERVHTGDKPYTCEICDKKFSQKANKTKHLKIHKEGTKPHTCGVCGRSFHQLEEMVLHRAGHGGGKPRKCDHCDERFRKLSELTDHVRRYHTFERPHKCAFCSKGFYSLYNLKQHVMIHTGQKPYSCAMCELKFTQKGNLAKHYERKHKNKVEPGKTEQHMINN